MTDYDLLAYAIRDRKWKNGALKDLARAVLNGQDIWQFLDEIKGDKWSVKIAEEYSNTSRNLISQDKSK